jgi:hypothetical protein
MVKSHLSYIIHKNPSSSILVTINHTHKSCFSSRTEYTHILSVFYLYTKGMGVSHASSHTHKEEEEEEEEEEGDDA